MWCVTLTDSCSIEPQIKVKSPFYFCWGVTGAPGTNDVHPKTEITRTAAVMWLVRVPLLSFPLAVSSPFVVVKATRGEGVGRCSAPAQSNTSRGRVFWYSFQSDSYANEHKSLCELYMYQIIFSDIKLEDALGSETGMSLPCTVFV